MVDFPWQIPIYAQGYLLEISAFPFGKRLDSQEYLRQLPSHDFKDIIIFFSWKWPVWWRLLPIHLPFWMLVPGRPAGRYTGSGSRCHCPVHGAASCSSSSPILFWKHTAQKKEGTLNSAWNCLVPAIPGVVLRLFLKPLLAPLWKSPASEMRNKHPLPRNYDFCSSPTAAKSPKPGISHWIKMRLPLPKAGFLSIRAPWLLHFSGPGCSYQQPFGS